VTLKMAWSRWGGGTWYDALGTKLAILKANLGYFANIDATP